MWALRGGGGGRQWLAPRAGCCRLGRARHEAAWVHPPWGARLASPLSQCAVPADLGPVSAVAAGWYHTCAVKADGHLVCFGWNNSGGQCAVPADLGPVSAVAAGWYHTCAVKADGHLVCFGWNNSGGQCAVPADLGPVSAIAAGHHTCAVKADGRWLIYIYIYIYIYCAMCIYIII